VKCDKSFSRRVIFAGVLALAGLLPATLESRSRSGDRTIRVKLEREVTTKSASPGDAISARLTEPLPISSSSIAPAGSRLEGRVDFVQEKTLTDNGWMLLLFNRVVLPDGQAVHTTASASFFRAKPHTKRNLAFAITGLAAFGALLGGDKYRVTGGLGGALAGLVIVENRGAIGEDVTLRAGQTIQLRLNQ
jgi:hypothetical protein